MNVLRSEVIAAFEPSIYAYSNMTPYVTNNFIDSKYMLCILAVACEKAGDTEIQNLCNKSLNMLADVGKDARTYANSTPSSGTWKESKTHLSLYYKEKPQASAGNMMAQWARQNGITVTVDEDKTLIAKSLCLIAPLYGYVIRWIPKLRQHINTVFLSHLLLGKTPPNSMHFLAVDNPFYSWLYGEKCNIKYPVDKGAWPAKIWPDGDYPSKGKEYSPVCQLAADFLQSTL